MLYRRITSSPITGEGELPAGVLDVLLADGNRPVLDVQIIPEEGNQFTFSQAAHQLQIEHGEYPSGIGGLQVGLEMLRPQGFHFHFLHLWSNAVISGVVGDEPLLYRPLERAVKHQVDASHRGTAEAGIAVAATLVHPAMLHQAFVHLLEIPGGQLFQLYFADAGDGVGFDHQAVSVCRGQPDIGLGVEIVPGAQPCGYRVFIGSDYVQGLALLLGGDQFLFGLGLGLAQYIFDDAFVGFWVVASRVAALPAPVRPLPQVSLAVGAFFG